MAASAALLAAAMLAGCAGTVTTYPSLAPRPIEKMPIEEPVDESAAQASPAPAAQATDARVATQVAAVESARARFAAEIAAAKRAVSAASGQSVGSEAWVAAQQALSRVDQARDETATALANLDAMMVAAGGAPSTALATAWAQVLAIDEEQRNTLTELNSRLAQP